MYDLRRPIETDSELELLTDKSEEGLEVLRHSTAHLMAQALKRLYGDVKFGVGPAIEEGFYYELDMDESISEEDLHKIEKEIQLILDMTVVIERRVLSIDDATELFQDDQY